MVLPMTSGFLENVNRQPKIGFSATNFSWIEHAQGCIIALIWASKSEYCIRNGETLAMKLAIAEQLKC